MAELRDIRSASNLIYWQVSGIYGMFILVFSVVARLSWLPWWAFVPASIAAWGVTGWGQFALFNALHEGLHNRFGRKHSQFLTYLFTAYPVGFGENYKQVHLDHHRYFGDAKRDPDYVSYAAFPKNRQQLLCRMLVNMSGLYALMQLLGLRQSAGDGSKQNHAEHSNWPSWLKLIIVQLSIFAVFAGSIGWLYYFWLWVIPIVTFGKFFAFLRTFCEHASPDNKPTVRTITGSGLSLKLLGVFNFHYHAEHHEYVFVPYVALPEAHHMAAKDLYLDRDTALRPRYEHFDQGYFSLLRYWYTSLPTAGANRG